MSVNLRRLSPFSLFTLLKITKSVSVHTIPTHLWYMWFFFNDMNKNLEFNNKQQKKFESLPLKKVAKIIKLLIAWAAIKR